MKNPLKKIDRLFLSIALDLKTWVVAALMVGICIFILKSNAALLILVAIVSFLSGRVFQRKLTKLSILFHFLSLFNFAMGIISLVLNIPVTFVFIMPVIMGYLIPDSSTFEEAKMDLQVLKEL